MRAGKTLCEHCGKKCSGEVLRVKEKYFHIACFSCKGEVWVMWVTGERGLLQL